ncbi:hypothetical protein PACQ9_73 [Pseudomonas phage PA_CQ9]|nr:hypothetical protein PACQ9_73 [Pseudomonas phage PA_CQ9]
MLWVQAAYRQILDSNLEITVLADEVGIGDTPSEDGVSVDFGDVDAMSFDEKVFFTLDSSDSSVFAAVCVGLDLDNIEGDKLPVLEGATCCVEIVVDPEGVPCVRIARRSIRRARLAAFRSRLAALASAVVIVVRDTDVATPPCRCLPFAFGNREVQKRDRSGLGFCTLSHSGLRERDSYQDFGLQFSDGRTQANLSIGSLQENLEHPRLRCPYDGPGSGNRHEQRTIFVTDEVQTTFLGVPPDNRSSTRELLLERLLGTVVGNGSAQHVGIHVVLIIAIQQVQAPGIYGTVMYHGNVVYLEGVGIPMVRLVAHRGVTVVTHVDASPTLVQELLGFRISQEVVGIYCPLVNSYLVLNRVDLGQTGGVSTTDNIHGQEGFEKSDFVITRVSCGTEAYQSTHCISP